MARIVSLRTRLLRQLVLLIVAVGGALLLATYFGNQAAVRTLSADSIRRAQLQTATHLDRFFDPVVRYLRIAENQRARGLLPLEDPERVNAMLVPVLARYPQVSSLMVADDRGREHMVLRMRAAWRVRQTRVDEWQDEVRWTEWSEEQPTPVERLEKLGYDPRTRPWFQAALEHLAPDAPGGLPDARWDARLSWTKPYTFFTTKEPGITAALARRGGDGITRVLAFDILLRDLSLYTTRDDVQPSANGLIAVVEEETNEVLGLPRTPPFLDEVARMAAVRKHIDEIDTPVLTQAKSTWTARGGVTGSPFRFEAGGQAWWGDIARYELASDRKLLVITVVPEADLLGDLARLRWILLGVVLLALGIAIWQAWRLADSVSDPIEALVAASERIARGELDTPTAVASDLREVQTLAEAQERMRLGLQVLMKLERDLQVARNIQQQTFPSILPGLKGFDVEGWSEPADETGGDTYDMIGLSGGWQRASLVAADESADRAVLMLADATGHGIGPALCALQLRAMLRMAMRMGGDLETIAKHMNTQLYEDLPSSQFLTTWIGMLDPDEGTLRTFSAGQAPLLRYEAASDSVQILAADAPPFGILPIIPINIKEAVSLAPGDLYIVFSDGIYEANDPDGNKFGEDRVIEIVRAHRHRSPRKILEAVRAGVEAFARGRPADDDRTAVIIKRL